MKYLNKYVIDKNAAEKHFIVSHRDLSNVIPHTVKLHILGGSEERDYMMYWELHNGITQPIDHYLTEEMAEAKVMQMLNKKVKLELEEKEKENE